MSIVQLALWPLPWFVDTIKSVFDIKKEQGEWVIAPWSLFGAPVTVIVMGVVIGLLSSVNPQLGIGFKWFITVGLYLVGMVAEMQNYLPKRKSLWWRFPFFPFPLIAGIALAMIIGIWL